jgi:TolB-like protein
VLDFEVQSDNPSFKYLGKGFAEFLAVELASAEGITIIEREKRNALLKEQEFALSDMADDTRQLKIGNLLSANYLLTGDIFDVFGDLAITIKLLDVESGSVVISAKADAPPKKYKRLIASLSRAVIASLDLKVQPAAAETEEVEAEQAEEVLTAFSEAVDAVDRNDITEARKSLRRAEKIDKTNKAVVYYLNKLFAASPKFNVELIYYAPSFNPAYLGFVEKDRFYMTTSTNWASFFHVTYPNESGDDTHSHFNWIVVPGLYYYLGILKSELGYYMPFGQRWGLGVELAFGDVSNITRDENYTTPLVSPGDDIYLSSMAGTVGGRVSAGFRILENMAFGFSGYVFNSHTNLGGIDGPDDPKSNTLTASVTLGFYSRLMEGKLTLGSHVTVPFLQEVYLDYSIKDYIAYKTAPYPVVWETSAVGAALSHGQDKSRFRYSRRPHDTAEILRSGCQLHIDAADPSFLSRLDSAGWYLAGTGFVEWNMDKGA